MENLYDFMMDNGTDLILYRGEQIEQNICNKRGFDSFNFEYFDEDFILMCK